MARHVRTCWAQVLDLGEIRVVDSWHEGPIRYEKLVTIPDYERCALLSAAPDLARPGPAPSWACRPSQKFLPAEPGPHTQSMQPLRWPQLAEA